MCIRYIINITSLSKAKTTPKHQNFKSALSSSYYVFFQEFGWYEWLLFLKSLHTFVKLADFILITL